LPNIEKKIVAETSENLDAFSNAALKINVSHYAECGLQHNMRLSHRNFLFHFKVDVYSFGLLLCEMCIRELPVPGHTHEQIRLITNAHLRELVQRNTNETPENRPTMAEVLTALLRLSPNSALGIVSINNRHAVV
jgi:serine/threonine protein kinase